MNYEIEKKEWHCCKICSKTIQELAKIYGGSGIYYTDTFLKHLEIDHKISIDEYFIEHCLNIKPKCKCEICNQDSKVIRQKKSNFHWQEYMCGRFPETMEWGKRAEIERKGTGNPMFGKTPWNNGHTKENCPIMKQTAEKMTGRSLSDEHIQKLKDFQSVRIKEPHKGFKHSEETKEKSRQRTLQMIKDGKFKQTKSKPHIKLSQILKEMNIDFEEERREDVWSFDFYLTKYNIYIEVDGDYFHSNPKFYPNGPKTNTQKINLSRDRKKNQFCENNKINLLRLWECDILNSEEDIKQKICNLIELLQ